MPSNVMISIGALRDHDHHFQGQTFLVMHLIYKIRRQQMFPADLPRLACPPAWSYCSCYYQLNTRGLDFGYFVGYSTLLTSPWLFWYELVLLWSRPASTPPFRLRPSFSGVEINPVQSASNNVKQANIYYLQF